LATKQCAILTKSSRIVPIVCQKKFLQVTESQKALVCLVAGAGFEPATFRL